MSLCSLNLHSPARGWGGGGEGQSTIPLHHLYKPLPLPGENVIIILRRYWNAEWVA